MSAGVGTAAPGFENPGMRSGKRAKADRAIFTGNVRPAYEKEAHKGRPA